MAMLRIAAYIVLVILLPSGSGFVAAQTAPEIPGSGPVRLTGTLNPSLLVIIFIFCTPMILIGFAVIFILWWRRGEAEISRPSLNVLQPRPASAARGMDARAIEELPMIIYADIKSLVAGKGALECAVCLSEFGDREKLRLLPKCDHVFHIQCIGAWLCDHVTCPVCRSDLAAEPVVERRTGSETTDVESQSGYRRHEPAVNTEPDQENRDHVTVRVERVTRAKLLRWNSTGHLWVNPGESQNTDRFTLKLRGEIRNQILGVGEESSIKLRKLNRKQSMSERWFIFKNSSFLWRNGSSIMSPKGIGFDGVTSIHVRQDDPLFVV